MSLPPSSTILTTPERLFCGTSGWAYPSWRPEFYPAKMPPRRFLEHYSTVLNTVESNYSFRTLPTAEQLAGWLRSTPPGFRFSFKAPQGITHFKRLLACEEPLREFLQSLEPVRAAGQLGVVLFQLPPNFRADPGRLRAFLALPHLQAVLPEAAPRLAFEFRHPSWFTDETYTVLADAGASLCIADTGELDTPEVHSAPAHTCFRLRRPGGYTPDELQALARRFRALAAEREVYLHFRHEDEPTGALNAVALRRLLTAEEAGDA